MKWLFLLAIRYVPWVMIVAEVLDYIF